MINSRRDFEMFLVDRAYRIVLNAIFLTQTVLMIGFSFADLELRLLLEFLRDSLKKANQPDFILLPEESVYEFQRLRLRDDFGIEVVPSEPSPGHPEFLESIDFLINTRNEVK